MAFIDRVVEHPNRYNFLSDEGEVLATGTLQRAEGEVTEEGTPLNAEHLNAEIMDMARGVAGQVRNELGIQRGRKKCKARANQVTQTVITFPQPYASVPVVVVSPVSATPQKVSATVTGVSTTGFTIALYRTNNTDTSVNWIATGVM